MDKFCKVLPYKFNSFSSFYEKLNWDNFRKFQQISWWFEPSICIEFDFVIWDGSDSTVLMHTSDELSR